MNGSTAKAGLPEGLPTGRWVLAAALLVAEYLLAIFLFDSERLPVARDTGAFAILGESMPLVIVVMTAVFLVGARPSQSERAAAVAAFQTPRRAWPWLTAHLFTYALALGITVFAFNADLQLQQPWFWVGLWAASGIGSLLLLIAAVIPRAALRPLLRPLGRALAAGIVVGLLALLAGAATSLLWRPLSRMTLEVVALLLALIGQRVVSIPGLLIVGTPEYEVFVDRPCSGYEGIGLIAVMLSFYLFFARKTLRFPNALLLLPIGIALIWIANSVRIAALIMVGTVSPEIAEGGFHSAAGWLLFCLITLGLVAVSRKTSWFAQETDEPVSSLRTPEAAFLLPLLVLIATSLATNLFIADFDYLYPLRVATPLIPLWAYRRYYGELRWSWSWAPPVLGLLVFILWVALEPPAEQSAVNAIPLALADMSTGAAALWLTARVVGSVVVVPVAEELAFRGYLLRRLIDADFTAVSPKQFRAFSFVVSSVAFGLLHDRWLAGVVAGMAYAIAQYRRGEIADAIVAHAVTNALLAGYVLAAGHWNFW